MRKCPECGRSVDKESVCGSCGHVLIEVSLSPETTAAHATVPTSPVGPERPRASRSSMLLIAIGVCGVGSLILLASATRSKATPPRSESPAAQRVAETVPSADRQTTARRLEVPRSSSAPRWTATRFSVPRQPEAIALELVADKDIAVWQSLVRPVLTIRCAAKTTEVFVLTNSAASFEPGTRQHTVKLSFDNGGELVQMWDQSVDHDALFASDGAALINQIAGAERMSFTFTPYNAQRAVVTFSVAGFRNELRPAARKSCGLKTP